MKIENSGSQPVMPKNTDNIRPADKKTTSGNSVPAILRKDHAEVTENARLLSKARTSLESVDSDQNGDQEKIKALRQQVENGTYTVPVDALAKRLLNLLRHSKNTGEE